MNTTHRQYCTTLTLNTLDELFQLIDSLDPQDRDAICMSTFNQVVNVGFNKPQSGEETLGELMKGPVNYRIFKDKCVELNRLIPDHFLVTAIVHCTLTWGCAFSDDSRKDEIIQNHRRMIDRIDKRISEGGPDTRERESLERLRDMSSKKILTIDDDIRQATRCYNEFCDKVVLDLIRMSESRPLHPYAD